MEGQKIDFEKKYLNEKDRRIENENEITQLESKIKELRSPKSFNENLLKQIRERKLLNSFRNILRIINSKGSLTALEKDEKQMFEILVKNRIIKRDNNQVFDYDFTQPKGEEFVTYFNNWEDSPSLISS